MFDDCELGILHLAGHIKGRFSMTHDPRTEPLREWNRLARENTENAIVSSMFESAIEASKPLHEFSTWLLVGTAAVASFLITNSDKLVPLLGAKGFAWCGALLCLSCFFGLLSKLLGLRTRMGKEAGEAVRRTFAEHLARYEAEEAEIQQGAKFWGIDLQTGVRIDRVLSEFYKPLPWWASWLAKRQLSKHAGDPQVGYLILVNSLNWQGYFAAGQAVSFLAFLVVGFVYTVTI